MPRTYVDYVRDQEEQRQLRRWREDRQAAELQNASRGLEAGLDELDRMADAMLEYMDQLDA
jgi:transcription initiation factor TFIIIB Brf1 subunit/transcription initiation factor TFIIB